MKAFIIILFSLVLSTAILHAETTPEDMINLYFEAFKQGDMDKLADNMHVGELEKFKQTLLPVIENSINLDPLNVGRDAIAIQQFMGRDDIETVRNELPTAFFNRFMKWMMKLNPKMKDLMAGATIHPLGVVVEDDMSHVMYRVNIDVMGANISQLKIMSVKKQDGEWRLMMTGEIEGMGKLLQLKPNP